MAAAPSSALRLLPSPVGCWPGTLSNCSAPTPPHTAPASVATQTPRCATASLRLLITQVRDKKYPKKVESVVTPLLATREMKTNSSSRKLFDRFCQLLCENCRTRHDVKFYADKLCITPYYLSQITSRIFQVSPKELIDRQLMMEIKALLTTTNFTVTKIADRYCFESASYLGRYFRRYSGMTPLEYRKQQAGS